MKYTTLYAHQFDSALRIIHKHSPIFLATFSQRIVTILILANHFISNSQLHILSWINKQHIRSTWWCLLSSWLLLLLFCYCNLQHNNLFTVIVWFPLISLFNTRCMFSVEKWNQFYIWCTNKLYKLWSSERCIGKQNMSLQITLIMCVIKLQLLRNNCVHIPYDGWHVSHKEFSNCRIWSTSCDVVILIAKYCCLACQSFLMDFPERRKHLK